MNESTETPEKKTRTRSKVKSTSVTWRMPIWVAEEFAGDWTGFRDILEAWAKEGECLEIPEVPDDTTSICIRLPLETLAALDKEAKRLSKFTKRKWTAGKVARKIYEDKFERDE